MQQGYQVTFYTQQTRMHGKESVVEWLMNTARELGISGATVHTAFGGYGRDGKYRSSSLFDLAEQTVEVVLALTPENQAKIFEEIAKEGLSIFYTKISAEFGIIGGNGGD